MCYYLCFLFSLFLLVLSSIASDASEYFNADLIQYFLASAEVSRFEKQARFDSTMPKDAQMWCNRAKTAEAQVQRQKETIREIEQNIAKLEQEAISNPKKQKSNDKMIKAQQKRLQSALKKLQKAEADVIQLHEDARTKDIPAGWLRCQFSW